MNVPDFNRAMETLPNISATSVIAAAVSGGPDSMAMLYLLAQWARDNNKTIYAYTVDHGLRAESADEASQVSTWVKDWPNVRHRILRWEGAKPDTRVLEEARTARYELIARAMKEEDADILFVAHHQDDQAETFLMRLAKGSGLDGLSGMQSFQKLESGITLARPLLDVSKDDLVRVCKDNNVPYVEDPTNENTDYLRPRLRAARAVLEEEGLNAKRLATTAKRLSRAKKALEFFADDVFARAVKEQTPTRLVFADDILQAAPEDIHVRVLARAMDSLSPAEGYGPRTEKMEALLARLRGNEDVRGATLGGCIFRRDAVKSTLIVEKE